MAACLRHAGQDMDHSTRDHLQQLLNEYCCTNFVKARGDPTGHKALLSSHSFTPDPLAVAVSQGTTRLVAWVLMMV